MTNAPTTRETADHAELARLAEALRKPEIWQSYPGPEGDFEIRLAPFDAADALEILLSEIAALRGEVENLYREDLKVMALSAMDDDLQAMTVRATQAERQRDELRKALEPFATYPLAVKMDGTVAPDEYQLTGRHDKEGIFRTVTNGDFQRARQAHAITGADQ